MSLAVNIELERFGLYQPGLLLKTGHLVEIYVADKVQGKVQIVLRYPPRRALDGDRLTGVMQTVA